MLKDALSEAETKQMTDMREADKPVKEAASVVDEAQKPEIIVQVETKVEPKAETKEQDEPNENRKKVPVSELIEERRARQEAEKRAREFELAQAKAEERMKLINEAIASQSKPKEQPKAAIDPDKDALGALKAHQEEIALLKKYKEERDAQDNYQRQTAQTIQSAQALEQEFVKTTPDYNDAANHIRNLRANQLAAFGMQPQQIQAQIQQEIFQLAQAALQQGKNPAELVYNLAKQSGFTKKPTSNGVAETAQPISDQAKIDMIAEGQKANMSLSNVSGGSTVATPMTARQLANLSDAEFSKMLSKMSRDQQKALMGD